MEVLYKQEKRVRILNDPDVRQIFKLDIEKRKKKGVVALETWTELAGKVLEKAEKELEQRRNTGLEQ